MHKKDIREILKEQQANLFQTIFTNSYDGIFVTDKNGCVLIANPASSSLLDTPFDELIGSKIMDLVNRGIYDKSIALEATKTGKIITGVVSTASGIQLMSTSTPIFDKEGNIELVITTSRAIISIERFWKTFVEKRKTTKTNVYIEAERTRNEFIYDSPVLKTLFGKAMKISQTDSAIVIYGETGVGKGLLANQIHKQSQRSQEPFVEINCAAIPEMLM